MLLFDSSKEWVLQSFPEPQQVHRIRYPSDIEFNGLNFVSFSPDGKLAAVAFSNTVVLLWRPSDGMIVRIIGIEHVYRGRRIYSLEFTPDGAALVVSSHMGIRMYKV